MDARKVWGVVSLVVGLLGFCASAAVGGGGTIGGSILAGLLNPLFFVGVPLGIWLLCSTSLKVARSFVRCPYCNAANDRTATHCHFCEKPIGHQAEQSPTLEAPNPKLTHCADCGRHVSRLATICPHCGRPLSPADSVQEIEPKED